jgi:hydrogenase maturation protein HypF
VVQGVGFRPYVHALATELELTGLVRNDAGRVHIEIEGPSFAVAEFSRRLTPEAPSLARIDRVTERAARCIGDERFLIQHRSDDGSPVVALGADLAPCEACLAPQCGPELSMRLSEAAAAVRSGKIVAVKGAGGFHLACDARDDAVVGLLRQRKGRDQKPFAVMVSSVDAARALCVVCDRDAERLESLERPIVVMEARAPSPIAPRVAPNLHTLGLMLPSTLVHHLLIREVAGVPLVMTSGNRSDEPIAIDDDDARLRLCGIAEVFLGHDRPIHVRCDDSVVREGTVLRRSRGFAPLPFTLPYTLKVPTLAVGGMLQSTVALAHGKRAMVSHHLGDLQHHEAFEAFQRAAADYQSLFGVRPERVVADLHPDDPSAIWASGLGLPVHRVQHHVAHVASCLAEHGATGRVAAVAFDGAGWGADGTVWGGEFFVGDLFSMRRVAHLSPVPLPGGAAVSREGWRMALMRLREAGLPIDAVAARVGARALQAAEHMVERRFNAPLTSSAGRLFDAAAWLVGVGEVQSFEGQAAMRLEALAARAPECGHYPIDGCDARPIIRALVEDKAEPPVRARRFHSSVAHLVAQVCRTLECADVVLTGGIFQNALLARETEALLSGQGMRPLRHREVPPNDGGLSLGQLAVVAAHDESGGCDMCLATSRQFVDDGTPAEPASSTCPTLFGREQVPQSTAKTAARAASLSPGRRPIG